MDNIESLRNFSKSLVTLVTGCYSFYIFSLLQPTYRLCTGNIDDNCIIIMAENIKISNVQKFSIIQCFIYTIHTSTYMRIADILRHDTSAQTSVSFCL